MKVLTRLAICFCLSFLIGCTNTMYTWDGYDQNLYDHYKNPVDHENFMEKLKNVIASGESSGKVPPGIYAEYGFALYEKQSYSEAIGYFRKEQDKWPESKTLMAKMISNSEKGQQKKDSNNINFPADSELPEVKK